MNFVWISITRDGVALSLCRLKRSTIRRRIDCSRKTHGENIRTLTVNTLLPESSNRRPRKRLLTKCFRGQFCRRHTFNSVMLVVVVHVTVFFFRKLFRHAAAVRISQLNREINEYTWSKSTVQKGDARCKFLFEIHSVFFFFFLVGTRGA